MASTLTVKDMNQEIVRDCMKGLGPVSKSVLSRKTGLSFPTVSKTVDLLCETGEVEEAGTEKSGGGRCAALYRPVSYTHLVFSIRVSSWETKSTGFPQLLMKCSSHSSVSISISFEGSSRR